MANIFHTSHGLVPIDSSDFAPTFNGFYITHGLVPTDGAAPIPSITSISPNICKHTDNCTVTIIGVNFGSQQGNGQVFFGPDEAATYVSWIDTQIVVTTPTKTGLRDIIDYVRVKRNGDTTDEVPDAIRFYHDGLRYQEITAALNAATGAQTAAVAAQASADANNTLLTNATYGLEAIRNLVASLVAGGSGGSGGSIGGLTELEKQNLNKILAEIQDLNIKMRRIK